MSKELYVGNLPFEATEADVSNLFAVAGRVTSIHLITDQKTGLSKGCGYVRMSTEKEAREAVSLLDEAYLINRQITVSIARPQKQAPPKRGKPANRAAGVQKHKS